MDARKNFRSGTRDIESHGADTVRSPEAPKAKGPVVTHRALLHVALAGLGHTETVNFTPSIEFDTDGTCVT